MKEPHCTKCDQMGHYAAFCRFTYPSGRIPTSGKYQRKWLATKAKWRKDNPPNHEGYHECYICHKWVEAKDITVDHVLPRSHAPELRYDLSNLKPCCSKCNNEKGSRHDTTEP